jgi:hypothetical protein
MAIVAQGQAASGLDVYIRFQGVLTDPLEGPTYVIKEPAGTTVGAGSGYRRSTGIYDARNTVIPSGYSITESWTITWTATSPAGITSSQCQEFSVVASLDFDFNNLQNITDLVKLDLGLTDDDYTDVQFQQFTQKAINRINRRLQLTGTSSELSFDEGTGTITPTPNSTIFDFIIMQIECFIVRNLRKVAVGKGIRVRDGETEIDTTAGFGGHRDQVNDVCGELDEAVDDYLKQLDKDEFSSVVSENAEIIWYGNTRTCEDLDHDGQDSGSRRCIVSPFERASSSSSVYMDFC